MYKTTDKDNHLNWLCADSTQHRPHLQRSKSDARYINNFDTTQHIEEFYKDEAEAHAQGLPTYGEKYWVQNDFCLAYWLERNRVEKRLKNQIGEEKFFNAKYLNKIEKIVSSDAEVLRLQRENKKAYERENQNVEIFDYSKFTNQETKQIQTSEQLSLFA